MKTTSQNNTSANIMDERQAQGTLTLVILIAHDLDAAVVEADGEAGTIGLHIALRPRIPVDPGDADGTCDIGQAADGHFHL